MVFHGRKTDGTAKEMSFMEQGMTLSGCIESIIEMQTPIFGKSREEILDGTIIPESPFIFELVGDGYGHHITYRIIKNSCNSWSKI